MRHRLSILAVLLVALIGTSGAQNLASPFSNSVFPAQVFTATGTGAIIQLNGLNNSPSIIGSSFSSGTITVTGTSLTTATFALQASSDNGVSYHAMPLYDLSNPAGDPSTSITITTNGVYQVNLAGHDHIKYVVSGTFTATNLQFVLSASPQASVAKKGGGSSGSGFVTALSTSGTTGPASVSAGVLNIPNYAVTNIFKTLSTTGTTGPAVLNGSGNLNIPQYTNFITSLSTTGTTGPATVSGGVLNIPQYTNFITSLTTTGSGNASVSAGVLNIPPASNFINSITTAGFSGPASVTSGNINIPEYSAGANCANAGIQSGGDIGAKANAAYASLPNYTDANGQVWKSGCVIIPAPAAGYYVQTTTIYIDSPYVNLYGEGQINLWWNGTGDAIRIWQTQISGGLHFQLPMSGTTVSNFNILNQTANGVSGIHASDMQWVHLINNTISGFNGGATCVLPTTGAVTSKQAGVWIDNVIYFTEDLRIDRLQTYDNCIGERYTRTGVHLTATGTGSGTALAIASPSGTVLINSPVTGNSIPSNTYIIAQVSGTAGGAGTYTTNNAITTVGATFTATGTGTSLVVTSVTGSISVGNTISGTGVPTNTTISAQVSGPTGGAGTYTTSVATTASGASVSAFTNLAINGQSQNSFAYGQQDSILLGTRSGEVGVTIEAGAFVYSQSWRFSTESNSGNTIGMYILGTFGGVNAQQGGDNWVDWRDECVGCSPAMSMLTVPTGGIFRAGGSMIGLNNTATVNITGGTNLWSGTTQQASTLTYFGVATDGGFRGTYNNALAWILYANNWRLSGGSVITNLAWSTAPATVASFFGIGPKSNGVPTLCVNQGTTGTCNGDIEARNILMNSISGVDGLVCSVAGAFTTTGCPTDSLTTGADAQLLINQGGGTSYLPKTINKDCTTDNTGAFTCTKSNNVAFGSAAFKSTGASGSNVPLMSGNNTWSGQQTFSDPLNFSNGSGGTIACSTSGSIATQQPFAGVSYKKVVIYENACLGTATYTYNTAFVFAPAVMTNSISSTVGTPSTTAVTITGTTSTGFVILEGW